MPRGNHQNVASTGWSGRPVLGHCTRFSSRPRENAMDQSTQTSASKAKSRPSTTSATPTFEFPKFGIPNFEVPKMEIPAAYREFAEKNASQAKATYEKMRSAADEASDALEGAYASISKGVSDCGHKVIEAARVNANAQFDY